MLNIVNGKTLQISTHKCLENIKELRKSGRVIVICPDRMALQVEEQIFDILNVSSLFDVDVYTLSRLTQLTLSNMGSNKKILSKQLAVALIKKIVLENELSSFKEVIHFNGFALKLFEVISMFKSSMITPKMMLEHTDNEILREKLQDLDIVYSKYEEFLQTEYTDSFNRLNLFASSVTNEFNDAHIIFVGYDDFTKQMINIVNMFIQKSKSVTIATASDYGFKDLNNKNIFVNNIFYYLIGLCKSNGYIYHIDVVNEDNDPIQKHLLNNIYSYNVLPYEGNVNNIKLVSFNNDKTELDFVLKDIKYKVTQDGKLKYGNFSMAIPDLSSRYLELQTKFAEFNIPYFLDISTTLNQTNLVRYILNIYELIINNFRIDNFLNVLKDNYSNIDINQISQFEDMLYMKGIQYVKKQDVENFDVINQLYEHISKLNDGENSMCDKILNLKELISHLDILSKTNQMIEKLTDENNVSLAKEYKIAFEKFDKAIEELELLMPQYILNIDDFVKILNAYLENVSVTVPPIIDDVVMVYDINSSFIEKNDYMYILSCVEGLVPSITNDTSLIMDKEINYFEDKLKLGPTCENINKRSKFKSFENIFKYNKQLTISYYKSSFGSSAISSSLVVSIKRCLSNLVEIDGDKYITEYDMFDKEKSENVFLLNNVCENSAITNLVNLTKNFETNFNQGNFNKYYFSLVYALPNKKFTKTILSNHTFDNNITNLNSTSNFFNNHSTSVSEIETYYNCPFKHYVRYGLKIAEKKPSILQPNDIGNIIHEFNSKIIGKLNNSEEDIEKLSNNVLDKILSDDKYAIYVNNRQNKHAIKNLYEECNRVALAIFNQQQNSEFKNKYNEKFFDKLLELSTSYKGVTIFVKGFIDRIDVKDDMFALIDYKTGADEFSFTDLKSGKKLQLFVYVKATNSITGLTPVCTCYMPIRNDFSRESINRYKFKGVFSNSLADLQKLDKNYLDKQNSNIGLTFNKDGGLNNYTRPYSISGQDILKLSDIAFDLVVKAIEKILDGDISIKPLFDGHSACNNCKYKGICNFDTLYQNKYRFVDKVSTHLEIINKENDEGNN